MFKVRKTTSGFQKTIAFLELLYHSIVRSVRKSGGTNALMGLLGSMMQTVIFVLAFYFMFQLLGMRGAALRGDFLLYIMSGIFVFMVHTQVVASVSGADGPTAAMMKHAPMNTMLAIGAAALGSLYTQILTLALLLLVYHLAINPVEIYQPAPAFGVVLLGWLTGVGVGMVFLALTPWAPGAVKIISQVYQRVNMFASGKMFVANTMPSFMIAMFDWNPLFHCIDQGRGFIFINYNPHNSSLTYPLYAGLTLVVLGLMGEFYTRKHASQSWGARR